MSTQDPLYSTDPIQIRGARFRFVIDARTGRGEYQWQRHADAWQPFTCYPHRVLGLVTLAELDRVLYQPNRQEIATARQACTRVSQSYQLTTQQMAAQACLFR